MPELTGYLRDFGNSSANYDANGHFARIQPLYNTFSFTDNAAGGLLQPQDPDDRLTGLQTGFYRRCPGGASQPAADGSAPFRDDGTSTATRGRCSPGHEAHPRHRSRDGGRRRRPVLGTGADDGDTEATTRSA
jgi:hypothetical protein